jgi:EmrB/QacA subfamily drug resistance transporter
MALLAKPPCDAGVIEGNARRIGPVAGRDEVSSAAGRWVLAATILGSSMVFIDGSVVNVALPTIQSDLDATAAQTQWVIESYALFLAALILVGGSFGDHFGRRRIFVIGTLLFAVTSVWCGLAPNAGMLITARAAQGIAGALLTPASLAIISATFSDQDERGRAIGTWSGLTAITAALGPVLGGWLVETLSWRWIFFLNIPFAVAVLGIAVRMPESRERTPRRLDWTGSALATIGLGGATFGMIEAPADGWGDPLVLGSLLVGVTALVGFVVVEWRGREPMMPLGLFSSRTFSGTNLLTFLLYAALGGALFYFPFTLIEVQGYSSTAAGAAFLPFIALMFALSRWSGGLATKYGAKRPLVIGPLIAAAGFLLLAVPGMTSNYWTSYFAGAVVLGFGMTVTVAPLTTAVMGAIDSDRAGIASGVNNAVSRAASLLAIALFGIVVAAAFGNSLDGRIDDLSLTPESRAAIDAEKDQLAAAEPPSGLDPATAEAVAEAYDRAFLSSFRLAMIVAAAMSALSAVSAWFLVSGKNPDPPPGGAGVS